MLSSTIADLRQGFRAFTLGTSAYLALQSLPLLVTPRVIFSLLASDLRRISSLETYLCRSLSLALLALAALNLLLSGALPLSSAEDASTSKEPYAFPTVVVMTAYHAGVAAYLYANITTSGLGFGLGAGLAASSALFALGLWTILFGSEQGHMSKTTGADKRTGNFPFRNSESAKEIKKKEKESTGSAKRRSVARTRSERG